MKTLIVLGFSLTLAGSAAFAQADAKTTGPGTAAAAPVAGAEISFEETKFDFGTVTEGDKVEHVFKFRNSGTEPLILSNVQTTCGCTVPEWPKEPIMPGKSGIIKATFNTTGKGGQQNKVITVISNSAAGNTHVSMLGTVNPKTMASPTGQPMPAAQPAHNHAH